MPNSCRPTARTWRFVCHACSVAAGRSALDAQETEVLALLAQGASNGEIAKAATLSEDTVKCYLRSIRAKFGTSSRACLVALAYRNGVVTPSVPAEATAPVLSDAERTVLGLLSEGATTREVARRQLMSHHNAKEYVRRLLDRMGAADAAHGVSLAYRWQILADDREEGR
ncbi:helix-turn-helix transcriptional regulator [Streptomyces paludis]|uniref:helix-turn-helix transcriptional regulator n=1 Tax=Streptomyces paludis TaxID=2282738 RepID=UPI0022B151B1|nr:LuxR C-terminal-related transcriptional regulator [Streptomyces paludis]